jgi:plasmid stability protein
MRTILTLDDDVAAALQSLARARGASFEAVVNHVLRRGLSEPNAPVAAPYRIEPVHLGGTRNPDLDDVGGILLVSEGDDPRLGGAGGQAG